MTWQTETTTALIQTPSRRSLERGGGRDRGVSVAGLKEQPELTARLLPSQAVRHEVGALLDRHQRQLNDPIAKP